MDNNNNGQNGWQPNAPVPAAPAPDHYTAYAHQIPEHGTPDPAPVTQAYNIPPPSPVYNPEPMMPVTAWSEPVAASPSPSLSAPMDDRPVPVVKVLSVRGIEYAMMSILLWFTAASLITILVALINGGASFETLSFPASLLVVGMPAFAYFYIRLRRAELRDPSLRLEASKRRFSQITQIVAFLTCFFNIVALVAVIMSKIGGGSGPSIPKLIGSTAVILLVAGGILAYYWIDEHKLVRK